MTTHKHDAAHCDQCHRVWQEGQYDGIQQVEYEQMKNAETVQCPHCKGHKGRWENRLYGQSGGGRWWCCPVCWDEETQDSSGTVRALIFGRPWR